VATTYYLDGTKASGINHLAVQTASFGATNYTDTGWDTTGVSTNRYSELYAIVVRAAGTFGATAVPTTIDTTNGNGWRLDGPLSGTFAAGNWTFSFNLRATANSSSDAGVSFLVWKSANADGSGGSAVGALRTTTYKTNVGTTAAAVTNTYDPSGGAGLTLSNEYLFLLASLRIDPSGGGQDAVNVHFRAGGTTHAVVTTDFTAAATVQTSTSNRQALLRRRMGNGRRRR